MRSNYYYLVSSLPYLVFDIEPSLSEEDFIIECQKWLSLHDLNIMQNLRIDNMIANSYDIEVIKMWKEFNKEFKKDLAAMRISKKNLYQEKKTSAYKEVFEEDTPFLMEKKLERIRWDFINQCELWYDFDINRLTLYFLKLKILERLKKFNKKEGQSIFDQLSEVNPHTNK